MATTLFRLFAPDRCAHLVACAILIDFSAPPPWAYSIIRIRGVDSSLHRSCRSPTKFFGNNRSVILAQLPSDRINYAVEYVPPRRRSGPPLMRPLCGRFRASTTPWVFAWPRFISFSIRGSEPICSMPTYSKVWRNHLIRFVCGMRGRVAVVYSHSLQSFHTP